MVKEQTLILLKPDSIQRNVVGKVITHFEDAGFKIKGMKMIWADEKIAKQHYCFEEVWAHNVYEKAKNSYEKEGKKFPYKNHLEYEKTIQKWNINFFVNGQLLLLC